jgi:hypothetical protein
MQAYSQLNMSPGAANLLFNPMPPQVKGYVPTPTGPESCGYTYGDFWGGKSTAAYSFGTDIRTSLMTSGAAVQGCAKGRSLDQSFADLVISKPLSAVYGDDLVSSNFALETHKLSYLYDLRPAPPTDCSMGATVFGGILQSNEGPCSMRANYRRNNVL